MCPDEELLSAYFDGELTDGWNERIENHAAGCDRCKSKLAEYRELRRELTAHTFPAPESGPESVKAAYYARFMRPPFPSVWQRNMTVPLPVALVAAILILAMATGFLVQSVTPPISKVPAVPLADSYTQENLEKMAKLVEYLNTSDAVLEIRISLPVENDFDFKMGEPTLLKASDFTERR